MSAARFVWLGDTARRRNQFAGFERTFSLPAVPAQFPLHLFADTRYRLRVNGEFVGAGPGRFVTQFPEYDTHELAPLLRAGDNRISVEVNFYGASSFQSMPDGEPGFIAWGGSAEADLATPGEWLGTRLNAWRWDAPLFSFAQSPVEICDTRLVDSGTPAPLITLDGKACPWGELKPYSGQPIPYFSHRPKKIELAAALKKGERRLGFMSHKPPGGANASAEESKSWTAFATWIHSPKAQVVTLSCFWSTLHLNGHPVPVDTDTPQGNHGRCTLELVEGWNLFTGELEILAEFWAYCLGIPEGAGLSLHGRRDLRCEEPFSLSPNSQRSEICLPGLADCEAPKDWTLHAGDWRLLTPARMMGWDEPAPDAARNIEPGRLSEFSTIDAAEATWCFSFEGEFLGHVAVDVEAPSGTVMDVACDDWQHANGGTAIYRSNPFTDAADRFVLRGGRQRVELFHPRGGKLLQVTLRAPAGKAALSLHDIFVRSRQTLGEDQTHFRCDNPVLNWAWPVSMRTLLVSTDESYSDCPWRERGSYIGDCYVNIALNQILSGDHRTARRALRVFAQSQLPNGQLPGCAPSWLRHPLEDFTLIWLLALHDFWASTGDTALAEELWPTVQKIWGSPTWESHSSGLWNATRGRIFIDWGILPAEREGEANATINLFRFGAAKACANLAGALGKTAEAGEFLAGAKAVETALLKCLWNDAEGRFNPSLEGNTPALHANTLALAFGLGEMETRMRILAYLEPKLRKNFAKGIQDGMFGGHLELYFLHYALPALAAHGRPDLAELLIDDHYGFLQKVGDDTLPETFCRVEESVGSRCHSWSGAAAIYAARYVLGIRQRVPGQPNQLVFDPVTHGITRASGRIAHPGGWIDCQWESVNGSVHSEITAPHGVEVLKSPDIGAGNDSTAGGELSRVARIPHNS